MNKLSEWVLFAVSILAPWVIFAPIDRAAANSDNPEILLELARQEFGTLTQADIKLFNMVGSGNLADYSAKAQEDNNPAESARWSGDRVLNAKRIAWLCTDPQASALVTHWGILVRGARIDGKFILAFARIPFPLYLEKCAIPNGIYLQNAEIRALYLNGTHTGVIKAGGLKVEGNILLRNGFRAVGEVNLLDARIGGNFVGDGGWFVNRQKQGPAIKADRLKVDGTVFMRNDFMAMGEVSLYGATIGGDLVCDKGRFTNQAKITPVADRLKIMGSALRRSGFPAESTLCLLGAKMCAQLDRVICLFVNRRTRALTADGIKVEGNVFLRNGFQAEGEVRLTGALIGCDLNCARGTFINKGKKALTADKLDVKGSLFLCNGFKAEGEVRLVNAKIGSQLDCSNSHFINPGKRAFTGDMLKVEGNAFFSGIKAEGKMALPGATINGYFIWVGLTSPAEVTLDLRSAKIGTLWDDPGSWPPSGALLLNGLVYNEIYEYSPIDYKTRIDWLHRQPDKPFQPQPYEQLAAVLSRGGHQHDADWIHIEKNKDRARLTDMTWCRKLWHGLLGITIGYGYRPQWALGWSLIIILLGWILFGIGFSKGIITKTKDGGCFLGDNDEIRQVMKNKTLFNVLVYLLYSLDMFVPLINLHLKRYWLPKANWKTPGPEKYRPSLGGRLLCLYMWLHTIAGWILVTLLVIALAGLMYK